jgi:three-Cys-motif partner protein
MNRFGGDWTEQKIEIVVSYVKAYLTIMNKYPQFKTMYFDGFAGSGNIYKEDSTDDIEIIKGTAIRVLEIDSPKSFDTYYFVEKNEKNREQLQQTIATDFSEMKTIAHVVNEDCNKKLKDMAAFLKKNPSYRVLAFIDPYGMSLNWESIESLKGLGVDLWILVPTGIGVNRLLRHDSKIEESWLLKLEKFLGLNREEILKRFYKQKSVLTLFGEESTISKETDAVNKAADLYRERLGEIFEFVSEPYTLKNSNNSIMYHFMMASNNKAALKIANDVIKPKFKM